VGSKIFFSFIHYGKNKTGDLKVVREKAPGKKKSTGGDNPTSTQSQPALPLLKTTDVRDGVS